MIKKIIKATHHMQVTYKIARINLLYALSFIMDKQRVTVLITLILGTIYIVVSVWQSTCKSLRGSVEQHQVATDPRTKPANVIMSLPVGFCHQHQALPFSIT